MVISNRDIELLRSMRRIYTELQQLREELKEQRNAVLHSPSLDGMPKGGEQDDKMIARMVRIESMERREAILVRKLTSARGKAYHVCRNMPSVTARMFFEAYCADFQPVDTAQKYSGADDQTVREYLKMLGEDK